MIKNIASNIIMNDECVKFKNYREFLIHMIQHHQVAVDMSERLKKYSTIPYMLDLARNISYIQKYEIWIMKMMVAFGIPNISLDDEFFFEWNPKYNVGCYYPRMSEEKNVKCDPKLLHPGKMEWKMTNVGFLEHMIPHHQIAVNMSRELLRQTKSPIMLEFANEIIKNQQYEIWFMKFILSRLKPPKRPIFPLRDCSPLF